MDIIWKKLKILTFPFSSYYSFRNPDKNLKDYSEKILFREVGERNEKLDKIKLMINSIYDNEENTDKWILSQIEILSDYFLTIRNNKLYIDENEKYEDYRFFNIFIAEGENIKKYLWYYLKRIINKDILKTCFITNNLNLNGAEIKISNSSILTTDSLLDSVLNKGISETHMHAGAGRSFSFLWIDVMNNKMTIDIEIMTYDGIINIKNHLLLTQLIRMIMSKFLKDETGRNDFKQFIRSEDNEELTNYFYGGNIKHNPEIGVNVLEKIEKFKKENGIDILNIESTDDLEQLTLKTDSIVNMFNDYYKQEIGNYYSLYGDNNTIIFPENVLLFKAFKYLKENDDKYFSRIFIQYMRIKNIFEQYVRQQDNDGKGLDIFKEIYKKQSKLNLRNSFGEVFYTHFESQNIKKMEIRIKPEKEGEIEKTIKTILKEYLKLLDSLKYSDTNYPLMGIVFHFIKEKSNDNNQCYYLHEKLNTERFLHFGDIKNKNKKLAYSVLDLLNRIPEIGNYIVGIDSASGENDTEPYVFKEIYEMFRKTENMYDRKYVNNRLSNTVGFTYHVGEDFRDIISGLRHIDEVIEHYNFISGDRIGHGIVLGISIEKWCEINKTVFLPINEYLDDLLWEWGCYNNNEQLKDNENIAYLENCIYKASEIMFGYIEGITVRDLYDLYLSKFYNDKKYILDGCIEKETKIKYEIDSECKYNCFEDVKWNRAKLRRVINCKYFLKGIQKNVSIEINKNRIDKYKKLQEYITNKISQKGIVIELNPTSNILIGEFNSYKDFHVENLSSPKEEKIIITINTDDPITFNTKLSNEYSLVMDLMIKKGKYTRKEILDWLDKIRENGNNFSFIKDRGMNKSSTIEEVKRIIEKL